MSAQRDWPTGGAEAHPLVPDRPPLLPEPLTQPLARRPGHGLLDPSLKTIFDDLVEGVLVLDAVGLRTYSNPALNELVGGNACQPLGSPEPPFYVPLDQRQRYLMALKGTASLLTMEGPGGASTSLELVTAGRVRVRTRLTISSFTGFSGWHFGVWLLNPEMAPAAPAGGTGGGSLLPGLPGTPDAFAGWEPPSAIDTLTRREKDVLQLLMDGRRVVSIARDLYLSPQTVRNHLKAIFRKLGAHSQAELLDNLRAAREAATSGMSGQVRNGLRPPPPTSPVPGPVRDLV